MTRPSSSGSRSSCASPRRWSPSGSLAGGVAHDFNNLLTVISGYSELALLEAALGRGAGPRVGADPRAGERAAALTRQLLAFSRKQVLQPGVLDLNIVVGGMEKMLRRLIGEDIELVILAARLGQRQGRSRPDRAGHHEPGVNARDAMPAGGKLRSRRPTSSSTKTYAARARRRRSPGRYVMLGVTRHRLRHGRQRRRRASSSRSSPPRSRARAPGLGLSTVYGIVKQSGGTSGLQRARAWARRSRSICPRIARLPAPALISSEPVVAARHRDRARGRGRGGRALAEDILRGCGYTVLSAARP